MLINRERANEVMDRHGLDALVAVTPINIEYLSDYRGPLMRMGRLFYNYALLPRRAEAPAALIVNGIEYHRLARSPDATWMPNIRAYLHPIHKDRRDFDPDVEDPEAVDDVMSWPIRPEGISQSDEAYLSRIEAARGGHAANPLYALKQALRDAGLERAVIGCDDPRIGPWLEEIGMPDVEVRDALNIFREVRMVKSRDELDRLRAAARLNEQAMETVLAALSPGMTFTELQSIYNVEIARGGGRAIYLACGQLVPSQTTDVVVEGHSITFDALCELRGYHGDLGRVAICGEPSAELLQRMRAVEIGCEVAYKMIKPGVTGNAVTTALIDAIHKAGFPGYLFATPHSVGLEHSDHPLPVGPQLPGGQGEFVFLENMVFTIDMPYRELGWGAIHVEDQLRVTATGVEPFTSCDVSLRVKPGRPLSDVGS